MSTCGGGSRYNDRVRGSEADHDPDLLVEEDRAVPIDISDAVRKSTPVSTLYYFQGFQRQRDAALKTHTNCCSVGHTPQ